MAQALPSLDALKSWLRRYSGYGLLAFAVIGLYELARPAAESLFLEAHGSAALPWVWAAVAPASVLASHQFGLAARTRTPTGLFALSAAVSALLLAALLGLVGAGVPGAPFALYVWKDVYIVVLVEAFWAHANARVPTADAKWTYGGFTAAGAVGGIVAGTVVGPLASGLGTAGVLGLLVPGLLAVALGSRLLGPVEAGAKTVGRSAGGLLEGIRVVRASRYLTPLLGMVLVSQLVITLVDWTFNHALELRFPDTDLRTGVLGQVYAVINVGSLVLQVGTGFVLAALGVGGALVGFPLVLGVALAGHALAPIWLLLAGAKAASKVFDYSIARAAKELLYIPLSRAEQTQGKALVDVMTYRTAKGGAALLVAAAVGLMSAAAVELIALGFIGGWTLLALTIARRYRDIESA